MKSQYKQQSKPQVSQQLTVQQFRETLSSQKKLPSKIKKEESNLQTAIATYIKSQYPDVIFTSESSGVRLTIGQAVKVKSQRCAGKLPDMIIDEARGGWFGLRLEIKTIENTPYLKPGKLSSNKHVQEQAKMLNRLYGKGYYALFAIGLDHAKRIIDGYMNNPLTKTDGTR